jgi:large subunit ribosomal protein L18
MAGIKLSRRNRIKEGIRKKIQGTSERPRLSIYRSNKAIYAQVIDDTSGRTIVSASSIKEGIEKGNKVDQSRSLGKIIAEKALAIGVQTVVFDRSGYLYHGRVKSLAEGAREGGLIF